MDGDPRTGPTFTTRSMPSPEAAVQAARLAHAGSGGRGLTGLVLVGLCISGLLLMVPPTNFDFYVGLLCLTVGIVLSLRFFNPRPNLATRRSWAAYAADEETFTINGSGITIESRWQHQKLDWAAVTEARDDGQILMLLRHGVVLCWLDRVSFASSEERASVVAFIRDQIAAAKADGERPQDQHSRRISSTRMLAIGLVVLALGYAAWTGLNRPSIFFGGTDPALIGGSAYSDVTLVVNGQARRFSTDMYGAQKEAVPILLQALGSATPFTGAHPDLTIQPVWIWLPVTDVPGLPSGAPTTRIDGGWLYLRAYFDSGIGVLGIRYKGEATQRYYQLDPSVMQRLADILYPSVPSGTPGV